MPKLTPEKIKARRFVLEQLYGKRKLNRGEEGIYRRGVAALDMAERILDMEKQQVKEHPGMPSDDVIKQRIAAES